MSVINITEQAVRKKLNGILRGELLEQKDFTPGPFTRGFSCWLTSLQMTNTEREIASKLVDGVLASYEYRLKVFRQEMNRILTKS